tara:strand:- start:147 stop:731 length:585 start_codon:yes stop_codon:yes gene_type:complete
MIRYKKLNKDEINGVPLIKYEGDIKVFSKKDNIQDAVDYLLTQEVIGFDTETRPTFTKGQLNAPSIMQLAGGDSVFIFQLGGSRMFEKLSQVLSEKRITKCGVSVDRDLIELMYLSPFDPCSFIDIGDVARARGIPHHGLRGLAALLLKHRISKSAQTSDWSRRKLSDAQISYAATDAWISLELFKKLEQENII